jgi:hypothetical protein
MRTPRRWKVVAGAAALALVFAACGDDDDETAEAGGDANSEYCTLAAELDAQEEFPSVEQLEAIQEVAPEEIREEVDAVVPVLREGVENGNPEAAFDDPVIQENFPAIEAYEADVCGLGDESEDEGDGEEAAVEIAPEDEDFCAIAQTLDEQEEFPTQEQLEEYRDTAPDEIAEEANVIATAFLEAGDDPFAAFDDPEVNAAFEVTEPFESEHCGIAHDGDEEEQDASVTELDPDAAQVAVTASEYDFEFASAPAAGRTSFVMTNEGEERHVMVLLHLSEGTTIDDALESEGEEGVEEEFESDTAAPGEEAVLTADLVAGNWAMICFLPTPDGTPHFMEGMVEEFTVS